ncbi:MAG: DUF1854 domain-containing protein [bacterium]
MSDDPISCPPPETEENPGLRYLEPASLRFFRHGNTLRLTVADEFSLFRACVVRAFPLSRATRYISVLDGSGREVGMIRELAELPEESRLLVQEELTRRYVIPVITRILSLRERCETEEWVVETERGPTDFTTRNLHDSSSEPSPGRLIIADVEGNRYEIPSISKLDPASRRFLSNHL